MKINKHHEYVEHHFEVDHPICGVLDYSIRIFEGKEPITNPIEFHDNTKAPKSAEDYKALVRELRHNTKHIYKK